MICSNCRKELDNDARFCPNCGTAQKLQEYNQADDSATIVENVKYYEFHNVSASRNYRYHYRLYFPLWFDSKFIQEILNDKKHSIERQVERDLKNEKKLSSFSYKFRSALADGTLERIPKYKDLHQSMYFFDTDHKKGAFVCITMTCIHTQIFSLDSYEPNSTVFMTHGKWFIPNAEEQIYINDCQENKNLAYQDYMEKCKRCLEELNSLPPN
ncbi:MAG: zinc ribbon domain-containing protein [Treponema sp.]|nr:zinc ribbon domain-containing protein [Treponema sp.]HBB12714.1 hypothetical protein [Treponema sp.]